MLEIKDISSRFQVLCTKVILINFTKLIGKQLYRSLFFHKVVDLKFKKNSQTIAERLFLLNTLYSLG